MASSNRPGKSKRSARNRARNRALAARSEAAQQRESSEDGAGRATGAPKRSLLQRLFPPRAVAPSSDGDFEDDDESADGDGGDDRGDRDRGSASKATAAKKAKPRPERPPVLRGRPINPVPRDGKGRVPGHRAALFALLFTVASVGLLLFVPFDIEREVDSFADVPAECEFDEPDAEETTTTTEAGDEPEPLTCVESVRIAPELGLAAVPVFALPLGIAGAAFWATTRERQARFWMFSMVGLALFLFVVSGFGFFFFPSLLALGVAHFQARKAEQAQLQIEYAAGITADDASDEDDAADER